MIEFVVGAIALLGVSAVFLFAPHLFTRSRQDGSERRSNLDWLEIRTRELAQESDGAQLLEDARLRLLEDQVDTLVDEDKAASSRWRPWWLLLPTVLVAMPLYYQLGGAGDVVLARGLESLGQESSEEDYRALMLQVEQRASRRPGNLHYQAMLGRYYMNEQEYGSARDLYRGLAERSPDDAGALALAAQAGYLAAGRTLDTENQVLAEQALAADPHQPTALGLLGMAAYEQGRYRAAMGYWQRLLVREPPDSSSATMIKQVIARAQAALGSSEADPQGSGAELTGGDPTAVAVETAAVDTAAVDTAAVDTASVATGEEAVAGNLGVSVRLQLAAGVEVADTATVFVFARNPAASSRMPVAARRLQAGELPLTVRLDDAASMAGQRISDLDQVVVVARISPSGAPGEAAASHQGQLGPLAPEPPGTARLLLLNVK